MQKLDWKVWTVIIVAVFVSAIVLWNKISKASAAKKAAANYNAAVNQSQTALTQLASAGVTPSYGQSQYTAMANALKTTFSGCGMDWNGVVIPTFQQMKNDADIYALIQNYGVQTFDECGWGSFTGDLTASLAYKTGGISFSASIDPLIVYSLNQINAVLKQNGLTFAF